MDSRESCWTKSKQIIYICKQKRPGQNLQKYAISMIFFFFRKHIMKFRECHLVASYKLPIILQPSPNGVLWSTDLKRNMSGTCISNIPSLFKIETKQQILGLLLSIRLVSLYLCKQQCIIYMQIPVNILHLLSFKNVSPFWNAVLHPLVIIIFDCL